MEEDADKGDHTPILRRSASNIATYHFTHESDSEETELSSDNESKSDLNDVIQNEVKVTQQQNDVKVTQQPQSRRAIPKLYYSTEDIHTLASEAEILVLTNSAQNLYYSDDSDDSESGLRSLKSFNMDISSYSDTPQRSKSAICGQTLKRRKTQSLGKLFRNSMTANDESYTVECDIFSKPKEDSSEVNQEICLSSDTFLKTEIEHKSSEKEDCSIEEGNLHQQNDDISDMIPLKAIVKPTHSIESDHLNGTNTSMGSWDHDLQEQYLSEGNSIFSPRETSLKTDLCYGEDYSILRRDSDLPSIGPLGLDKDINSVDVTGGASHSSNDLSPSEATSIIKMSERDWGLIQQDVDELEAQVPFGDKESYERMIATCNNKINHLKNLQDQPLDPSNLTSEIKDLLESWELLVKNLKLRHSQCEANTSINLDIEGIQEDLQSISNRLIHGSIDTRINNHLECLEDLEKNIKQALQQTLAAVNLLTSEVSSLQPNHIQKIALLCFSKQELTSLGDIWKKIMGDLQDGLISLEKLNESLEDLEIGILSLEQRLEGKSKKYSASFIEASHRLKLSRRMIEVDCQSIKRFRLILIQLNEEHVISDSYFDLASNYLNITENQLKDETVQPPSQSSEPSPICSWISIILFSSFLVISLLVEAIKNICYIFKYLTAFWPISTIFPADPELTYS